MGRVTGIEENDDDKLDISSSALSSRKQIANRLVYKLVRQSICEFDQCSRPPEEVMESGSSTTTFIVKHNKIVRKCEDSSANGIAEAAISMENMPSEDNLVIAEKRLRNHNIEDELGSEDHQSEQRALKRIRKPTKRYIEELSENESREHSPRLLSSNKNIGLGNTRPARNAPPEEARTFITRVDILGGSGVQIHCVSRSASEPGKEQCLAIDTIELQQELKPKKTDPSSRTSDGNIATVPTTKGGMRRKHHQAWTLVEVMKLVECGAGRWSEIKRLSFSSYSYRTSVDLKDKWRNLLKASSAPADDGVRVYDS
ncbi:unnamed protein product [Lupinus luteus]|uniref:Myb-like domain-containing protein n=1 Tax=Lupinus luteus TaxID=3873 RepID=A0AAV1XWH7_LUPLU